MPGMPRQPLELERHFMPCRPEDQENRSITSVPAALQGAFHAVFAPSFTTFNAMQSQVLDRIVLGQQSMALSAPTGSGKTVIFEMAGHYVMPGLVFSLLHILIG